MLKVGHHGSAYSSSPAFIAAVHPKYAIISVGRHNMFGHPAPSTLETLEHAGTTLYRTDQDCAVAVATAGSADPAVSAYCARSTALRGVSWQAKAFAGTPPVGTSAYP